MYVVKPALTDIFISIFIHLYLILDSFGPDTLIKTMNNCTIKNVRHSEAVLILTKHTEIKF